MSKEWKGNKKSVSTMLGLSTTWNPEQRAAGDYYTTDPTAVEQFIKHITKIYGLVTGSFFNSIWEPACGCGNISKVLVSHGYKVISSDLYDRGYGFSGRDFLESVGVPKYCNTIITNPPYALADDFVKHAMKILPVGGKYFALMNLSYLAGQKRYHEIYCNSYLRAIHVYPHRINCYKNNENTGHSSPVNYAWFEYVRPLNSQIKLDIGTTAVQFHMPPTIYWISK